MKSLLFVPADSSRKLDKALGTAADCLVLDLEDAVALGEKERARGMAREFLDRERQGKVVYVRVNAYDTGMVLHDLQALMPGRPDGIVLPKSLGGQDVALLDHQLDGFEACLGFAVGSTSIIPVVTETPQAMFNLGSYQNCSPRLWGLMWGAEDLAGAIGASGNRIDGRYRSTFRNARDMCLLAAAAANVVAIDTVVTDVSDMERVRAESIEARIDGFGAKAAIYPPHCEIINEAFMPEESEIAWAKAVLQALAQNPTQGVLVLDGQMIDKPHLVRAQRILARVRSDPVA
jgi:citrate lyase subunit beta/citryl-CoA lyase